MMHSGFEAYMPEALPPPYPYDAMVDNNTCSSTQMDLFQVTRRLSRGAAGQRSSTTSRVSKPNSTANSPGGSSKTSRRRTVVNDAQAARRHQQAMEYMSASHEWEAARPKGQQSRPVSWHPSTHVEAQLPLYYTQQQQQQQQQVEFSTPAMYCGASDVYSAAPSYSPLMTTYSNTTSPSSSFSSLPVPYQCEDSMAQMTGDGWQYGNRFALYPSATETQFVGEAYARLDGFTDDKMSANGLDWNSFIMHGYNTTSPPTPDSFLQTMANPAAQAPLAEASIHSLEDAEDEGEILVGMGLYDDKCEEDPCLNTYRSTVTSLLGSAFRAQEPKGKGLKLEETWEPPKSDEEGDSEDEPTEGDDEE